jgi:dienelactone hydrolase
MDTGHPLTRRWTEQRWLLDNVIQANGLDWDQPRSVYLSSPCGPEANADFAALRLRIRKYADASPAFEAVARRRQAKAEAAEQAGELVTARDNYFMAATHWGAAQWPIDSANDLNLRDNASKRACYLNYAQYADHQVEPAWIQLGDHKLPAWLHLPYGYSGGKVPVVISVPGMDSFKESAVSLYGDRWLNRGIAVLAIDGPGQYESPLLGIYVTTEAWAATGRACLDYLLTRPEIDGTCIGISGTSFGSFFMFMANYTDEAAFDRFAQTLSWRGHAEKISVPYFCATGEADELSPLRYVEEMIAAIRSPRQFVIYQDSRHAIGNVPSTSLGPFLPTLIADWMLARLNNQPMQSERWFVDATGRISRTSLA